MCFLNAHRKIRSLYSNEMVSQLREIYAEKNNLENGRIRYVTLFVHYGVS